MSGPAGPPSPGDTVLGRYAVREHLGSGVSSQVFRVQDAVTGLDYALKYPTGNVSAFVEREVRFWLRLAPHRNVVSIADLHFDEQDRPYLLLEYAGGGTLQKRMTGRPWPNDEALLVLRDVAAGMAHGSSRVNAAHLDLKPENVLLDEDGTAKVSDFGLVREVRRTRSGYPSVAPATGTVGYQAPEIVLGEGPVDSRCDIYSFGLIAVELLTGKSIFPDDVAIPDYYRTAEVATFADDFREGKHPLAAFVPDRQVRLLVAGCLMFRPEYRFTSFTHVLRHLWMCDAPASPSGIAGKHWARVQADAARRALSEARILDRMGEVDAALQAVNRSVLFSKRDAPTRVAALRFGASVLREEGNESEARRLEELGDLPAETEGFALDVVPVLPRLVVEPLPGQSRTAPPYDPGLALSRSAEEGSSRIKRVQRYVEEGKYASALNFIRSFLIEDRAFALSMAATVLHRTRTEHRKVVEPLNEFDAEDPWFDCIKVECSRCRQMRSWASPLDPSKLVGAMFTKAEQLMVHDTSWSQCNECRYTLCYGCRPGWTQPEPEASSAFVEGCDRCGGQLRFSALRATGRTRPWSHDLCAAPVECVVIRRAGAVQYSNDWVRDLAMHVSPDLLLTSPRLYGGRDFGCTEEELLARAARHVEALIDNGMLSADALERTEGVHGRDADGVPFAMLKVLRSPHDADKTVGLLFNIDRLADTLYGPAAYKILFNYLDPARLIGCHLSDGDTHRTLASVAREYCIAIQAPSPEIVAYIQATMRQCPEQGLLLDKARFLPWAAVMQEPLMYAGVVDESGSLVVSPDDMLREFHAHGTRWRITVGKVSKGKRRSET